jgi:hypothetical protein
MTPAMRLNSPGQAATRGSPARRSPPAGPVCPTWTGRSLRAAVHGLRTSRLPVTQPAAATTIAAIITALAVHTAG